MRTLTALLVPALLVMGSAILPGCGGGPKVPAINAGPPIPGLALSGKWYSQEFGDMQVVHTGKTVSGTYEDPRGPDHNGTFRGQVFGDLLKVEWIKPGNPTAAIMPVRGRAWLRIKQGGNILEGQWGYEASDRNGGAWNAEKSQYQ